MRDDIKALDVARRAVARTPALRRGIAYTILLAVAAAAGRLAIPILIQQTIDRGLTGPDGYRPGFVAVACLIALAVILVTAIVTPWAGVRMVRAAQGSLYELRMQAFRKVHDLSLAEHSEERRGVLLARVTSDIESVARFVQWGAISWPVNSALIVGSFLVMFVYSWQLALVAMGCFSLMLPLLRWLQRRQLAAYDEVRNRVGHTMATFSETLTGGAVINAYGYQQPMRRRLRAAIGDLAKAETRTARYFAVLFTVGDVFGAMAIAAVAGVAIGWGDSWGLQVGQVVSFFFLVNLVLQPVGELTELLDQTQTAVAGWNKVLRLLDRKAAIPEPSDGTRLPPGPLSITASDLCFSYDGRTRVLEGVDLEIPAGTQVAIVGETGSGKSTFAKLLCRLADPSSGVIAIDRADLREVDPESRRARIRLIPQDGFLFDTTVRDNVLYGRPDAPRMDVELAFSELGLDWWLDLLPNGLETAVGERGSNLSVGERQLVALARAQLADPGLLILDEATSAVDPETERALTGALARLAAGRTTVSIAHRLSTAEAADIVLVFHDGRLVEQGSHAELVAAGGFYAGLYRSWLGAVGSTMTEG